MQVRTVLYHQKVLDVTVESKAKPKEPEAMVSKEDKRQYKTELEAWEAKAAKANASLPPTICRQLKNKDDPAEFELFCLTNSILQVMLPLNKP